jgi:hypothetical protein
VAVSATLLATATPALAQPKGKIVGQVDNAWMRPIVIAKGADGRSYRAAVRSDGRFWINDIPSGEYVVTAQGCNAQWTIGTVTVRKGKIALPPSSDPTADECVIVGLMSRKPR